LLARRAPTVVLMYHRVGPDARDLHGLRVRDDRFVAQLAVMQRYAQVVPLAEVLEPSRRPRVAITFDDGYADNLHVAEPLLAAHDAPATVFVAAGIVETGHGFWQDRLAALVLDGRYDADHVDVVVAGNPLRADVRSEAARDRAYRAVHGRLRRRPPDEIEHVLADLTEQLGADAAARDTIAPTLTVDEVRRLDASPVVEIGSHTVRHPWLSALDAAAQRQELTDSKAQLEAWTGRTIRTFAYPFGVADAFTDTTVRAARDAGYGVSVTGVAGGVTRFTDPQRVPRRFVGDWDADVFERRFRAWIAS
jgi:peptidoglycan/xylan/chitin deacetylase (PgdA/CDA1 family)